MDVATLRRLYADRGAAGFAISTTEYMLLRSRIASERSRGLYSTVAPSLYRRWYRTDFEEKSASPDPFKLERIAPERINRFTPRVYPPWLNRRKLFGAVRSGNWDRRPLEAIPKFGGPPSQLFLGETVDESPLYRAMKRHFKHGVAWEETEFVREVLSLVEGGIDASECVWQDCRSPADVRRRCQRLEDIYQAMATEGCLSCRKRTDPRRRRRGFLDVMENEIVVDVGRDGDLLLVSGKHRLFLARVLELDTVPVAFLVRHANWMQTRRVIASDSSSTDEGRERHPDLRDLLGPTEQMTDQEVPS